MEEREKEKAREMLHERMRVREGSEQEEREWFEIRNWREKEREGGKKKFSSENSSQCRKMVEGSDLTRKPHLKVVWQKKIIRLFIIK